MSNLTKEDYEMLYWHAVNKMRNGEFRSASQFFNYVYQADRRDHVALGLAYCYYRDNQDSEAKRVLNDMPMPAIESREARLYNRLLKRVSAV